VPPVRDRSDWVWQSRWRQVYFVVATVVVATLLSVVIIGRVVPELPVLAGAGACAGLWLGSRRREP
jgi:hypothetical protein